MEKNVIDLHFYTFKRARYLLYCFSNSIIEHYKEIDELKDGIDSFIPEEVIK
jgi:hypothetical protein